MENTITTGFNTLDTLLEGGLHRSEVTLLTSTFTAMGKTSLATSILRHVARETEHTTAIFTLEGNKKGVVSKLVSMESGVNGQNMQRGTVSEDEHSKVRFAFKRFEEGRLWISDTIRKSVAELRAQLEGKTVDLVIVDYLELLRMADDEYLQVLADLKQLAIDFNAAVLAVCQIHSLIQESVVFGQDADTLLTLGREDGSETAIVTVSNTKFVGQAHLYFYAPTTRFFNSWEEYKTVYHGSVDD